MHTYLLEHNNAHVFYIPGKFFLRLIITYQNVPTIPERYGQYARESHTARSIPKLPKIDTPWVTLLLQVYVWRYSAMYYVHLHLSVKVTCTPSIKTKKTGSL